MHTVIMIVGCKITRNMERDMISGEVELNSGKGIKLFEL